MGGPIWAMLLLANFCVPFSPLKDKWLEGTSQVGQGHVLGPRSHVCTAILVGVLLAEALEI